MIDFDQPLEDITKRFLLFAHHQYYPDGGINDIRTSYDTKKEGVRAIKDGEWDVYDYCYLVDKLTMEDVYG